MNKQKIHLLKLEIAKIANEICKEADGFKVEIDVDISFLSSLDGKSNESVVSNVHVRLEEEI